MAEKKGWLSRLRGKTSEDEPVESAGPDTGRRTHDRLPAPIGLYYFTPPDRFVTLDLRVLMKQDGEARAVPCFLFDINEDGLGLASEEELPSSASVRIVGQLAKDLEPLVDCKVDIVNCRPYPAGRPHPDQFSADRLRVYGGTMEMREAMVLLRATLDCVAMQLGVKGEETAPEVEPPAVRKPTLKPRREKPEATSLSFGSLPLASVEVIDAELRRHNERTHLSMPLGYVAEDGTCHGIILQVGRPDKGLEAAHIGKLVDFSEDGARIETDRKHEVGEVLTVYGVSTESGGVLFEDRFSIRNRHAAEPPQDMKKGSTDEEFTFGATVNTSMEEKITGWYAYGLLLHESGSNLLYKAIMDSVLLSKLNEGRDEPVRHVSND